MSLVPSFCPQARDVYDANVARGIREDIAEDAAMEVQRRIERAAEHEHWLRTTPYADRSPRTIYRNGLTFEEDAGL
jgi:hypothetical protein